MGLKNIPGSKQVLEIRPKSWFKKQNIVDFFNLLRLAILKQFRAATTIQLLWNPAATCFVSTTATSLTAATAPAACVFQLFTCSLIDEVSMCPCYSMFFQACLTLHFIAFLKVSMRSLLSPCCFPMFSLLSSSCISWRVFRGSPDRELRIAEKAIGWEIKARRLQFPCFASALYTVLQPRKVRASSCQITGSRVYWHTTTSTVTIITTTTTTVLGNNKCPS